MNVFVPETLWYETAEGVPLTIDPIDPHAAIPGRALYQVSQFPCDLHTNYLRLNDDGSSTPVCTGTSGWWEALVLAMASAPWWRRLLGLRSYRLGEAILIVGTSCERCMNALAWRYRVRNQMGRREGYPEGSHEHRRAGTRCHFCDPSMRKAV